MGRFGCNGGRAVHISPISPYLFPIAAPKSSTSVLVLPSFRFRTAKSDRLLGICSVLFLGPLLELTTLRSAVCYPGFPLPLRLHSRTRPLRTSG